MRAADGSVLARLAGQPTAQRADSTWRYPISDAAGAAIGTIALYRTSIDVVGELVDQIGCVCTYQCPCGKSKTRIRDAGRSAAA